MMLLLKPRPVDLGVGMPDRADNLFCRVVRTPHHERACTDVLCALLRAAPHVRAAIMECLARESQTMLEHVGAAVIDIETEQAVGGKRDDLRIEAYADPERNDCILLWTIEVKVRSGFHGSPAITFGDLETSSGASAAEPELAHQILNYDAWLQRQPARHRGGFVLAPRNMDYLLPSGLEEQWTCVTWRDLAESVVHALMVDAVPLEEELLARHFIGYVQEHLWERKAVDPLDFDDIAVLRAFDIARRCEERVRFLVQVFKDVLDSAEIGVGDASLSKELLFKAGRRYAFRKLTTEEKSFIQAGIQLGASDRSVDLFVEIFTYKTASWKPALGERLAAAVSRLGDRAANWTVRPDPQVDLLTRLPAAHLLTASDQRAAVQAFVQRALDDLRSMGINGLIAEVTA